MTQAISNAELTEFLTTFIRRKHPDFAGPLVDDTALMKEGLVDSFSLVELIVELENRFELELPAGSLIPEDFESVRTLEERLVDLTT